MLNWWCSIAAMLLFYYELGRSMVKTVMMMMKYPIQYKLGVMIHRCLRGKAPQYLMDCCTLTSDIAIRQRLRSATRHQLNVSRHRCSRFGRRAFSVAGPRAWNLLPDYLRDPSLSSDSFRSVLKTYLFTTHRNT